MAIDIKKFVRRENRIDMNKFITPERSAMVSREREKPKPEPKQEEPQEEKSWWDKFVERGRYDKNKWMDGKYILEKAPKDQTTFELGEGLEDETPKLAPGPTIERGLLQKYSPEDLKRAETLPLSEDSERPRSYTSPAVRARTQPLLSAERDVTEYGFGMIKTDEVLKGLARGSASLIGDTTASIMYWWGDNMRENNKMMEESGYPAGKNHLGELAVKYSESLRKLTEAFVQQPALMEHPYLRGRDSMFDDPRGVKFLSRLAEGAPSMGFIIAMTAITKNPYYGIAFLSAGSGASTYRNLKEVHGVSRTKANVFGVLDAVGSAYLEKLPLQKIMGGKILAGAIQEGIQEGSQALWNNAINILGGDDTRKYWNGVAEGAILGAATGGIASSMFKGAGDVRMLKKKLLDGGMSKEQVEKLNESVMDEIVKNAPAIENAIQKDILSDNALKPDTITQLIADANAAKERGVINIKPIMKERMIEDRQEAQTIREIKQAQAEGKSFDQWFQSKIVTPQQQATKDEFVKAQPKLYHGTVTGNRFETFDLSKADAGISGNVFNQGNVAYFSKDKNTAKLLSKIANENKFLKNADIKELNKVSEQPIGEILDFNLAPDTIIKKLDYSPKTAEIELLKKQGFDGAEFPDKVAFSGIVEGRPELAKLLGDETTVAVWNTDKIKTKSQLIDIWNKAQKVEAPKKTEALPSKEQLAQKEEAKKAWDQVKKEKDVIISKQYELAKREMDMGDDPVLVEKRDVESQKKKILRYIENNPQKAIQIGYNLRPVPDGMSETLFRAALVANATVDGNKRLAEDFLRLQSSRASWVAQELVFTKFGVDKTERNRALITKGITDQRLERIGRALGEVDTKQAIEAAKKEIQQDSKTYAKKSVVEASKISENKLKKLDNIIDSLLC